MSRNPKKLIQNIQRLSGSYGLSAPSNTPIQYKDRQHEYLNGRNKKFSQNRAYLSNDYVLADVQGLNPDDFYEWNAAYVRFSDIAQSSSMSTRKTDDWKEAMFPQEEIDYFPIGAKLETMGSTWLNINPSNIGSAYAAAIMARCNSSYNSYDYYGNIITEPLYVGSYEIRKTATYVEVYHLNMMDGNIQITCQYNETTNRLGETKRLILGRKVYYITGYADYIQEFTGDRDSVHLITFTARVTEPTEYDDMLGTFIAGGKAETFEAVIDSVDQVVRTYPQPPSRNITPFFIHNGKTVEPTEEHPVTWSFSSSNESVATINGKGKAVFFNTGTVTFTAVLEQNPNIKATVTVECVTSAEAKASIEFAEYASTSIRQFTSQTYSAVCDVGEEYQASVNWTLAGADSEDDYSYVINNDNSITITCNHASTTPLYLTASGIQDAQKTLTLTLEGY